MSIGTYCRCKDPLYYVSSNGENRSDADREDKTERSQTSHVSKACNFLYWHLVAQVRRMMDVLVKKAKVSKHKSPEELSSRFVKLNQLQTLQKKSNHQDYDIHEQAKQAGHTMSF
ncbi:2555_t:CDS:2 [Paraglomus brasilianum]|uniref:2555_t:CDS:1 n=1 Tax=Paraglomus brasilianum TaxID=144538 RepID=A0A9N9H636_9GLOM|nr:2555_t:CDS:2 [Paraglomus brasilianum]